MPCKTRIDLTFCKNRLVGVGGLAALANKDSWQARPRLTPYQVIIVLSKMLKNHLSYFHVPISNPRGKAITRAMNICSFTGDIRDGTSDKNRLVGVGGLAALANKDSWQARPRFTLTYHVIFVYKHKAKKLS